ncbi:FAD-binding oxidoreductase [Rhizobiales bacterium]|uniref:NAD(P)/FAD-dependent oxidoreductase n=1 Tax=Hongsoonwoonella zoysiae TaxID=2821844 RepID=UPI00156015D3|nr:FAD-binding oxidoreductase [Hongsoonwoonella zoysiae]NRG18076.1 FAD-binding oxidoreductase [Hongsoonwoonella zoysiae]
MREVDVIVLGGGIVGITAAIYLRMSGRDVLVVERGRPGDEASRGNAGVLTREDLLPFSIPDDPLRLMGAVFNASSRFRYDPRILSRLLSWAGRLCEVSERDNGMRYATAIASLQRTAIFEHKALAKRASAERFFRPSGWIKLYRSDAGLEELDMELHFARIFGTTYEDLDESRLCELEPDLYAGDFSRALFFPESLSVSSPGGLTKAYARHLRDVGGVVETGDARSLARSSGRWAVNTLTGKVCADNIVVSLGAWSSQVLEPLGIQFPLMASRGYYRHFRPVDGVNLRRPIHDVEQGYMLSPMERGLRLTTGHEFTGVEAKAETAQLRRNVKAARKVFPLGPEIEEELCFAARPLLPDSLPVVGLAPGHKGLWLNFGHAGHGFTTAPATAVLLAQLMNDEEPFTDPSPLSPLRFGL